MVGAGGDPSVCATRCGLRKGLTDDRKRSPDHELFLRRRGHDGANPATLTVARKIRKRAFHVLRELAAETA